MLEKVSFFSNNKISCCSQYPCQAVMKDRERLEEQHDQRSRGNWRIECYEHKEKKYTQKRQRKVQGELPK